MHRTLMTLVARKGASLGMLGCRRSAWHVLKKNEFPHCHNMGNSVSEIGKMTIWGGEERSPVSRLNNSCCGRLIETEQTLVCREINRLANGMHVRCRHEACAKQVADTLIKVPFLRFPHQELILRSDVAKGIETGAST